MSVKKLDGEYMPGSMQCETCEHYLKGYKCKAYPKKIPIEIWNWGIDHREPYAGDHGIVYKEAELAVIKKRFETVGGKEQ